VVLCSSWGFLVPRVLGLIASVSERWEQAESHFADALEVAEKSGARGELGRTLLDYATMLSRRGSRNDSAGATEMLAQASVIFHELGMRTFSDRASALASGLGAAPAVVTNGTDSGSYPDHLSRREVEVLGLLSRGYTNKRIAEELVLSAKTVARHISNIFYKIRVDNRSAATAYAFEQGLAGSSAQERRSI
jgi:DNA-binding CsgD family transcriptional regulator